MSFSTTLRRLKQAARHPHLQLGAGLFLAGFLFAFGLGLWLKPAAPVSEPRREIAGLLRSTTTPSPEAAIDAPAAAATKPVAAPMQPKAAMPQIAIVLDDMGPNRHETQRAMRLPPAITFAFLPYADDVAALAAKARAAGHELLVHMPMQPLGDADPGPHSLREGQSPAEIASNLDWNLSRFTGYIGINNHMGSRFTQDEAGMGIVAGVLKARGLMFLDSRTIAGSKAERVARQAGVPVLARDVFLDHDEEGAQVSLELDRLEHLARQHGMAIAIGHPHAQTLDVLEKWIPEAQARGFQLVPLSALLHRANAS